MATITVGIPVYNGGADLAESLDCILSQTFRDLDVIVFDNASTDDTAAIAAGYVARDARVRYLRQPHNKGAVPNFHDVLKAAESPYFLWRACDDRSDADYIAVLHALLEAYPDKALAVGRVIETFEGRQVRELPAMRVNDQGGWASRIPLMFGAPPSAIYGLYRREALTKVMDQIAVRYGEPVWGWDYLAMLPFFLDASVVQTDATAFECAVRGVRRPRSQPRPPKAERKAMDFDAMLALRRRFLVMAREFADERFKPGPARWFAHLMVWAYANRRVYKFKRVARGLLKRWLGLDGGKPK